MLSRCRTVAIRILFDNFCKVLKEEIQVCFTKVIVFFLTQVTKISRVTIHSFLSRIIYVRLV